MPIREALAAGERYAAVAVAVPVRRLFTYRVDEALAPRLAPGARVQVPFGGRTLVGTVVEWPAAAPGEGVAAKDVLAVLSDARTLDPALLELTRFVADYYLCSWGEAIEAALPPAAGAPRGLPGHVRRLPGADPARLPARASSRRAALAALPADGSPVPLAALEPAARRGLGALVTLGWAERVAAPAASPAREPELAAAEPPPRPTPEQAAALERLAPLVARREYAPCLLFGATGSGKTEVYLRAAELTLAAGRDVLFLVPEIGLTPLLVTKIERRFPGRVAVLHSGLARRERQAAWESVRHGRSRLVLGTRSAVFAPLRDPGLIVVDEEQDGSYKQEETPRYNGRDVAVVRARAGRAVLLLGSATPSLESFRHARAGRYVLLRLGGRVERRPLPIVQLVDMREEYRAQREVSPLSRALVSALRACVERGEQALVLRNRRGWAPAVLCPVCGARVGCRRCSVALTWHRAARRLRCHTCNFETAFPECCPTCGARELGLAGEGTERIEDLLRAALPGTIIERMDRDTIRGRGAHERLLRRFESREIQVLVGTQMIAKGHDFPGVTLVGVLAADQALGLPDFRAGERAFQLLTQVAGRAGRGERPGLVVAQAFDPGHPLLLLAAAQDYEAFYDREMRYRRALHYPPLAALVQLLVTDREEERAREWAAELARAVREEGAGRLLVSGPGPAPLERLKGRYRQQILVRAAGRRRLVGTIDRAVAALGNRVPRRALQIDVDPLNLL